MSVFLSKEKAVIASIIRRGGRQELLDLIDKIGDDERYCSQCDKFLDAEIFKYKKGYHRFCPECSKKYQLKWRRENGYCKKTH